MKTWLNNPVLPTGDGICCRYRNGFVTVTKKRGGTDKAVIYKHDGEFLHELVVYLVASDDARDLEVKEATAFAST